MERLDAPASNSRDIAVVLSGGGVNGVYMEFGFLKRLFEEEELVSRVKYIFGTSSGALVGFMAAIGAFAGENEKFAVIEEFVMGLQPVDVFKPRRGIMTIPFRGFHEYVLERTIAERLADPVALCRKIQEGEMVLSVVVTDVDMRESDTGKDNRRLFELVYSSDRTAPEEMAKAILASAAVSTFGLWVPIGATQIGTDGGWVRNFGLGYAYDHWDVNQIIGFRCVPRAPATGAMFFGRLTRQLRRYRGVPSLRQMFREFEKAAERGEHGEPTTIFDLYYRLAHVTARRNDAYEEIFAEEKNRSVEELQSLRVDTLETIRSLVSDDALRDSLSQAITMRFQRARFPFRFDRVVPRAIVRAFPPSIMRNGKECEVHLEPGLFRHKPWSLEEKQALIGHGYALTDQMLKEQGLVSS